MINAVKHTGRLLFKTVFLADFKVHSNLGKSVQGNVFCCFWFFFLPLAPAKLCLVKHAEGREHSLQ